MSNKKVKIIIKKLPHAGRMGGKYRPHSIIETTIDEARELVLAGQAIFADPEDEVRIIETMAYLPHQNEMLQHPEISSRAKRK